MTTRHFRWVYDETTEPGIPGAGTVHHIAWHSRDEDHVAWQQRVAQHRWHVTPVIDRDYFHSIYFRQPQGSCSRSRPPRPASPSTRIPSRLGEELRLPAQHEHLRPQLERPTDPAHQPARHRAP